MARPQRNNVDYFPFLCEEGKKMYYLEETYGNDGFAVFVKLLRELAKSEYHFLDLSERTTLMFLSAKCKVTKEVLEAIINDLSDLEKFDSELWVENKIVWCQDFIDSIQDAYSKRVNKCIDKNGLLSLLISKGVRKPPKSNPKPPKYQSKGVGNTQSIEEYSIEEEKKEEETIKNECSEFSEKDEKLKNFLCDKFGVSEMKQPRHYMNIIQAIDFMKGEGEEINRHFRDQCFYYFKYKEAAEEKKHTSVETFLFNQDISPYRDSLMSGGWNKCNWQELGQSKFKSKYYEDGITPEDVLNAY